MKKLLMSLIVIYCVLTASAGRLTYSINEHWQFKKGKETSWEFVNLPHTWNTADVADEAKGYYRGIGFYKKELLPDKSASGKQVYIYFEGVNQVAELFVNGKSAGNHIGGYTRFCFDITDLLIPDQPNFLEIKVDNSHNDNIPPYSADFTFFGGIYRDVYLVVTDKVHISLSDFASSGVYIETPSVNEKEALVRINALVDNKLTQKTSVLIENRITDAAGNEVWSGATKQSIDFGQQKTCGSEFILRNPVLWSPDQPSLYTLTTRILDEKSKAVLDETRNSFGIRSFEFNPDKGFSLNGKPEKLIGTNRHQDFRDMGNALTDEYVFRDMKLLKDMGGNFLRISHYPQDPTVLEYCDRNGIASSVEIPIVNRIVETDEFAANCRNMMTEMIKQNFNHPSVMIWAYMNEVLLRLPYQTKEPGYKLYTDKVRKLASELEDIARTLDKQRYTMIPNHGDPERYDEAGLTKIPRILGWNLYQGWYSGKFEDFDTGLEAIHAKFPEKSLIVTEFGPGVDDRIRSEMPERFDFSAEYGQQLHAHYLKAILAKPFISGAAIWNLNDFYSETRTDATPHINNKGIVNTDRVPKDGYWFYQASLSKEPTVIIASRGWDLRSGVAKMGEHICKQKIAVFSNLPVAELFVNGKSLGQKSFDNFTADWDVPFVHGRNLIEVSGEMKGKVIIDEMIVQFKLIPYSLSDSNYRFEDLNVCLGANISFYEKNPAVIWLSDRTWEEGSWGAVGGTFYRKKTRFGTLPSSDSDILGTEIDPVFQTQRVGIREYIANVPDGSYAVSLYFAELESVEKKETSIYSLGNDAVEVPVTERIFGVEINKQLVLSDFNVAKSCGAERAAEKKFIVCAENGQGIRIKFLPEKGEPILNGIRIARKL